MDASLVVLAAALGAGGALVGAFFGAAAGFAVGRRERSIAQLLGGRSIVVDDECGCKHHRSYHAGGKYRCNHGFCGCRKYVAQKRRATLDATEWESELEP